MYHSPEYRVWAGMIDRCENQNANGFHNYGGRGISVCDRWRASFAAFYKDIGQRPSSAHSLDRHPNQDGNYEPGNCRWATGKQQMRNYRKNRRVTANGESLTLPEWSERLLIPLSTLQGRLYRLKWDDSRIINTPYIGRKDR